MTVCANCAACCSIPARVVLLPLLKSNDCRFYRYLWSSIDEPNPVTTVLKGGDLLLSCADIVCIDRRDECAARVTRQTDT
jgi:hypothetical protein